MKFKLNIDQLIGRDANGTQESLEMLYEAIRALYVFLEIGKFAISQELYEKLPPKEKRYFIGIK